VDASISEMDLIFSLLEEENFEAANKLVCVKKEVASKVDPVSGLPVIFQAVQNEALALSVLERAEASASFVDPVRGVLPLHVACKKSTAKVVSELLHVNPSAVLVRDKEGHTPLYYACQNRNSKETLQILDLLLGCTGHTKTKEHNDGVTRGKGKGRASKAVAAAMAARDGTQLVTAISSGTEEFIDGITPLHHAARAGSCGEVINLLLKYFPTAVDIPEKGSHRMPLHLAACSNAPEDCLMALVDAHPAALSMKDVHGFTPMALATKHRMSPKGLRVLFQSAEMRDGVQEEEKATLLHNAIQNGASKAELSTLLELVPDGALLPSDTGDVPIFTALMQQPFREDIVDLLLSHEPKCALAPRAVDGSCALHTGLELRLPPALIRKLLEVAPKAIRLPNSDDKLPLHFACWQCAPADLILTLLDMFPESIWEKESKYGQNALMYCAQYSRSSRDMVVVKKIIALDEYIINETNNDKRTALHLAAMNGSSLEMVTTLLEAGPQHLDSIDTRGMTPVQYALERRKDSGAPGDVVRLLLNKRAEKTEEPVKAEPEGEEIVVHLSDFERSTQEYELRCKMEELARAKTFRPTMENLVNTSTLGGGGDSGGGVGGAASKQELASLRRKVKAQAIEIRQLNSKAHSSLDAVELHNQMVEKEKQVKLLRSELKECKAKLVIGEKEVANLTEDNRLLKNQIKGPADVEQLQRRIRNDNEEAHHQQELLRKLRNDLSARESHISDLNLEVKKLTTQLKSQTVYVKEKEREAAADRARAEEIAEEIISLRLFKKTMIESGAAAAALEPLELEKQRS